MFAHVCPALAVVAPAVFVALLSEYVKVDVCALSIKSLLRRSREEEDVVSLDASANLSGDKAKAEAYKNDLEDRIKAQVSDGVLFGREVYEIFSPVNDAEKLQQDTRGGKGEVTPIDPLAFGNTRPFVANAYDRMKLVQQDEYGRNPWGPRDNKLQTPPIIMSESFTEDKKDKQLILYHCTDDMNAFSIDNGDSASYGDSEAGGDISGLVWTSTNTKWVFEDGCSHRVEITVDSTSANFIGMVAYDRFQSFIKTDSQQSYEWGTKPNVNSATFTVVLPRFAYKKLDSFKTSMWFHEKGRKRVCNDYHTGACEIHDYEIKKVTKVSLIRTLVDEDPIAKSWQNVANVKDDTKTTGQFLNRIQSYALARTLSLDALTLAEKFQKGIAEVEVLDDGNEIIKLMNDYYQVYRDFFWKDVPDPEFVKDFVTKEWAKLESAIESRNAALMESSDEEEKEDEFSSSC